MKYLDYNKIQSYNADMEVIIGARSIGKTYTYLKESCRKAIERNEEFGWVRRYKPELDVVRATFFDEIMENDEFPGYVFKVEGNRGYVAEKRDADEMEWRVCCHFFTAASAGNYKGTAYPRITRIIYDEYIREIKSPPGYLSDDVGALLSLWKTISRKRDNCTLTVLANACDVTNPLFQFLGIYDEPKEGFSWYLDKNCIVYYVKDEVYARQEANTIVGRIVAGSDYGKTMIDNSFANGGREFLCKKTPRSRYRYGFAWHNARYGVWLDDSTGYFYVSRKVDKGGIMFALTTADHRPNLIMIERTSGFLKKLMTLYRYGMVYFDTATTREEFIKMCSLLGLR